jgi:hypothetical protein
MITISTPLMELRLVTCPDNNRKQIEIRFRNASGRIITIQSDGGSLIQEAERIGTPPVSHQETNSRLAWAIVRELFKNAEFN